MKILKFIGITSVIIGLVLVAIALIMTKGNFANLKSAFFYDTDYTEITKSGDDEITIVKIDVRLTNLEFYLSDDESYNLEYYESEHEKYRFSVENKTLTFESEPYTHRFFFSWFNQTKTTKIYLPNSFDGIINVNLTVGSTTINHIPQLESLKIVTTTGSVNLENITTNDLHITTTTGRNNLKNITADEVYINTTTGAVNIDTLTTDQLKIITTTGSQNLKHITAQQINALATTGRITVNDIDSQSTKLSATTGRINIELTENDYRISVHTTTGKIRFQDSIIQSQTINPSGTKNITANTTTGGITINIG